MAQDLTLPAGWTWSTIGEITLPIEKVFPKEKPNEHFTYLDISSIDNKSHKIVDPKEYIGAEAPSRARQLVRANDVLFSTVRTYLENVAQVSGIYDGQIASTGFSVLRASEVVLSKLLFYYSLTTTFLEPLNELQRGTSYPAVRDGDVRVQPFPLPPLPEQERIVARIEELFTQLEAGTAALRRVQAGLKRYRASVLKAACEGKLVAQDPSDAPAEELMHRLGKKPLVGKDQPSLPEGWCWTTVDDLVENIQYGYTESANEEPIGPKFLRITDIQDGFVNWETVPYCKIEGDEINKYLLRSGDIVFARTGATTGKSYLINDCPIAVFASYLIRLRLPDLFDVKYFSLFLDSPMYWSQIMTVRKGSAQPGVNATILATLKVPLPPLTEARRIVAEVERRLSVAKEIESAVEAALARAARLRQAVLRSAFEGRL
jgi:type I restriction enzyme S subunit